MEMLDTLRNFINHMERNPSVIPSMNSNKITRRKTDDVNENDIHTASLEQVQKLVNEDSDLVFDTRVAADYIDKLEVQEDCQSSA